VFALPQSREIEPAPVMNFFMLLIYCVPGRSFLFISLLINCVSTSKISESMKKYSLKMGDAEQFLSYSQKLNIYPRLNETPAEN
jgi:hypothetical protein